MDEITPILVIDPDKKIGGKLKTIFQSVRLRCHVVSGIDQAIERINSDPPVFVVADKPNTFDELKSLNTVIKAKAPATPFVVILPELNSEWAVKSMRNGAFDCIAEPYDRFDVLAVAKRATGKFRRTLFTDKLEKPKRHLTHAFAALTVIGVVVMAILGVRSGPPPETISLGSAHLSGIQWINRSLWVGDWFDSTVTHYKVKRAFRKKRRELKIANISRIRDGQPILLAVTDDGVVSVGTDLKMRTHQFSSEMPTLFTTAMPASRPSGLIWDGTHVWSSDTDTSMIYQHGQNLKVLSVEKSLIRNPIGLAWDGDAIWVLGDSPLKLARLEKMGKNYVWKGPYMVPHLLPDGVTPSGVAVGFERVWMVSGGDPRMVSFSLKDLDSFRIEWAS